MNASYERLIVPQVVDSRLKLHLLLHYLTHPGLAISARALSERLRENPWALDEALGELAEAGLMQRCAPDAAPIFRLCARLEHVTALQALIEVFNDPLLREHVYGLVRHAQRERQFHSWLSGHAGLGMAGLVIG